MTVEICRIRGGGDSRHGRLWFSLALIALFCVGFKPGYLLNQDLVPTHDGASYLAHAFTIGLDFDLDYGNEIARVFNKDGNMPSHFIGSGLMAAPFVALFSVLDRINGHPVIGDHSRYMFSWSYFGFLFAVNCYFLLGIGLYGDALRRITGAVPAWLNCVFALSTGVLYYVFGRFAMPHPFEFAGLALVFWGGIRFYYSDGRRKLCFGALTACAVVLSLVIRINNLNVLALPFLVCLGLQCYAPRQGEAAHRDLARELAWLTAGIAVCSLPLMAFNMHYFHGLYPSGPQLYSHDIGRLQGTSFHDLVLKLAGRLPKLVNVAFSSEFGLLFCNPVPLFGAVAWVDLVRRRKSPLSLSVLALVLGYCMFSLLIVLLWYSTGRSYGYRYLFPLYPAGLLGVALWLAQVAPSLPRLSRAFKVGLLAACAFSLASILFFSVNPALTPKRQLNTFGMVHEASANGYHIEVAAQLLRPGTHLLVLGKSYLGYLGAGTVASTPRLFELVPPELREKFLRRFVQVPGAVDYQLFLLLLLWAGAGFLLAQPVWGITGGSKGSEGEVP